MGILRTTILSTSVLVLIVLSLSLPFSYLRNGDVELAYNSCLEGLRIAEEIGSSQYVTYASYALLEITLLTGNYQEALFYCNLAIITFF